MVQKLNTLWLAFPAILSHISIASAVRSQSGWTHFYEKDLEKAIITHLHDFLLELSDGLTFVARHLPVN